MDVLEIFEPKTISISSEVDGIFTDTSDDSESDSKD